MRKKRRIAELFVIFPMIFLMLTACGSAGYKKEVEENFTDNGKNEPYARQIPLDEMDFQVYDDYFTKFSTLVQYNYDRKISLPCDVEYYESKEDSEPILTLEKGTKVYVLPDNERSIEGYGWCCWPDYEEGWRYGNPFLTIDFTYISEEYPMYYVKSATGPTDASGINRKTPSTSSNTKKHQKKHDCQKIHPIRQLLPPIRHRNK